MDQATEYLVWKASDGSREVRIAHSVVRRITVEIMRGFGVTRRRGTESGGILLGRIGEGSGAAIAIEDFEAVPCEYAFGPSYVLSPNDQPAFGEAVAKWEDANPDLQPIGLWRSHTREGLTLEQTDIDLFESYFRKHGRLALLLKPFGTRPPVAGIVFPRKGKLPPGPVPFEFPFSPTLDQVVSAGESPSASAPVADTPRPVAIPEPVLPPTGIHMLPTQREAAPELPSPPVPVPSVVPIVSRSTAPEDRSPTGILGLRPGSGLPAEAEKPPEAVPVMEAPPQARLPRGVDLLSKVLFAICSALLGFVAGYQLAGAHIGLYPTPGMNRADASSAFNLGLTLDRVSDRLRVRWSPDGMAAQMADSGRLIVEDNGIVLEQQLQPVELRGGTVLYRPGVGDVRIRLELALPRQRTVTETVLWRAQR